MSFHSASTHGVRLAEAYATEPPWLVQAENALVSLPPHIAPRKKLSLLSPECCLRACGVRVQRCFLHKLAASVKVSLSGCALPLHDSGTRLPEALAMRIQALGWPYPI